MTCTPTKQSVRKRQLDVCLILALVVSRSVCPVGAVQQHDSHVAAVTATDTPGSAASGPYWLPNNKSQGVAFADGRIASGEPLARGWWLRQWLGQRHERGADPVHHGGRGRRSLAAWAGSGGTRAVLQDVVLAGDEVADTQSGADLPGFLTAEARNCPLYQGPTSVNVIACGHMGFWEACRHLCVIVGSPCRALSSRVWYKENAAPNLHRLCHPLLAGAR